MADYSKKSYDELVKSIYNNPSDTTEWQKCWAELQLRRDAAQTKYAKWVAVFAVVTGVSTVSQLVFHFWK